MNYDDNQDQALDTMTFLDYAGVCEIQAESFVPWDAVDLATITSSDCPLTRQEAQLLLQSFSAPESTLLPGAWSASAWNVAALVPEPNFLNSEGFTQSQFDPDFYFDSILRDQPTSTSSFCAGTLPPNVGKPDSAVSKLDPSSTSPSLSPLRQAQLPSPNVSHCSEPSGSPCPSDMPTRSATARNKRRFPCTRCYKSFAKLESLTAHMAVHAMDKRFACDFGGCDKRYTTKNRLTVHQRNHNKDRPYKCDYTGCAYAATQMCTLRNHQLIHLDPATRNAIKSRNVKTVPCMVCNKLYKTQDSLLQHQRLDHCGDSEEYI
ncbi:hypothetical protein BC830DRAFT_314892 [Chytriomyces sp. MP71]|nr:hypothetical protein BC830DRAFT_314892 [Chytriomyces sp. MP71]